MKFLAAQIQTNVPRASMARREASGGIDIDDCCSVKLRPCRFQRDSPGRFSIVRRAGSSRILVRGPGMAACQLFAEGCRVSEVKSCLAERYQVPDSSIDLAPLFQTLRQADLIASVNGQSIPEKTPPSLYSAYRYFVRFHLTPRLLRIAYRKLPFGPGRKLAYCGHRLDMGPVLMQKAAEAEEHFRKAPQTLWPKAVRREFAARYFDHLIRNIVDFTFLTALAPVRAEVWFRRHIDYEGLEHLEDAKKRKQGVIVAAFHFSTTKLIPLLLMRQGFDVALPAIADSSVDVERLAPWFAEFAGMPGFGQWAHVPDFSLPSYRKIVSILRSGGSMVWLADIFEGRQRLGVDAEERTRMAEAASVVGTGRIHTDLEASKLEVDLFGRRVYTNSWIGAFARLSGAVVIPAALVRQGRRMRLVLRPPLELPSRAATKDVETLNTRLFAELEPFLLRHPDQWFGWHSLCPV